MKIRNGFVSNSSSSSFILISKEPVVRPKLSRRGEVFVSVKANDNTDYNRDNNCKVDSIEEKVKYITILYAIYYQEDPNYFFKMDELRRKLLDLGKLYGYFLYVVTPPLYGEPSTRKWNELTQEFEDCEPYIETFVNSSTECSYISSVVKLIENEDTTDLESYIFNPHSFCILGGDEYEENVALQYEAKKTVNYPYFRIADYEDVEETDLIPGTNEPCGYTYHWGEIDPKTLRDIDKEDVK